MVYVENPRESANSPGGPSRCRSCPIGMDHVTMSYTHCRTEGSLGLPLEPGGGPSLRHAHRPMLSKLCPSSSSCCRVLVHRKDCCLCTRRCAGHPIICLYFAPQARKHILQIHTRDWSPRLSDLFLGELAEKCVGEWHSWNLIIYESMSALVRPVSENALANLRVWEMRLDFCS